MERPVDMIKIINSSGHEVQVSREEFEREHNPERFIELRKFKTPTYMLRSTLEEKMDYRLIDWEDDGAEEFKAMEEILLTLLSMIEFKELQALILTGDNQDAKDYLKRLEKFIG